MHKYSTLPTREPLLEVVRLWPALPIARASGQEGPFFPCTRAGQSDTKADFNSRSGGSPLQALSIPTYRNRCA